MLSLHEVSKSFGATRAVCELSLALERGEIFGLLGPNGAGKTTTIHLAVGLLRPDRGRVEIEGLGPPSRPEVRARIGVAPQALSLYEDLTGEENLRFYGRMYGLHGGELRRRVDEMLDFAGLQERRRDRLSRYSGGMKRRLNLAAALVHAPPLLLLDEPTAGVDPQSRNAIFEAITSLRDQGLTVLYTTHYMEEAERLCDRVGILDHGRLLALDGVDALIEAYGGASFLTVSRPGGEERIETTDPVPDLRKALATGEIRDVRIDRPDLEAVFLNLTGRSLRD